MKNTQTQPLQRICRSGWNVRLLLVALSLVSFLCQADDSYWNDVQDLRPGVKLKELSLTNPRLMKAWVMRIDLQTPGIGFVSTERAAEWGEPMPDYTNRSFRICTKREKTVDFMMRKRKEGFNVDIAVNTAPWSPWTSPYTNRWAHLNGWTVGNGKELSVRKVPNNGAFFVIDKQGRACITAAVSRLEQRAVAHAHPGFSVIADNGVPRPDTKDQSIHPRTAVGLSRNKRYIYLLVIDGRQPGYSLGARLIDLCNILIPAGADDIINMDGGGSTSLVVFDSKTRKPRMLNRHHREKMRPVALNFGITFD
jgi:hypothetical protein